MKVIDSVAEFRYYRTELGEQTIGFVPTMGALHVGHTSLLQKSLTECAVTILSIYLNPTQFDNTKDLAEYPETLEADLALADSLGVDAVLTPTDAQLYPDHFRYLVDEKAFSKQLCGSYRDGHFTGVLTVVMKLLNIVKPARAYFGEKDYQQYLLIQGMADAFFLDVDIVAGKTVREDDGVAYSSRNLNLDPTSRQLASRLYEVLASDESDTAAIANLTVAGFEVDYVETYAGRRYGAARLGAVRLIDNVTLSEVDP